MTDDRTQHAHGWADSGPVQVADGVHRIPIPLPEDGLSAVNCYAIEHPDGVTLIDPGWPGDESLAVLKRSLAELGFDLADISEFLVTHIHRDHYPQGVFLRERFGSRLRLGIGERDGLRATQKATHAWVSQYEQLRLCGAEAVIAKMEAGGIPEIDQSEWKDLDAWLSDHEVLTLGGRTLEVVATPGHTVGHVVFLDRDNGLLFSGDHVLPHITPSIGFESVPARLPLADYLCSLEVLLRLPELMLLPAHGGAQPTTHSRVRELQEHHDVRLKQTLKAVESGATTTLEVARELGWTRRERSFTALDTFNQMLATLETRAHLELLVDRGLVTRSTAEGIDLYAIDASQPADF